MLNGAKALSSKVAPEAPEGQFRRFHRKSMIFAFFGHLEARLRCHLAISGVTPVDIILFLLGNAIKLKVRVKFDCSKFCKDQKMLKKLCPSKIL